MSIVGQGIYLGTFCYMICAVTNDSNVNTAPVFWVLLGMGIAINQLLKKELHTENQKLFLQITTTKIFRHKVCYDVIKITADLV